MAIGVGTRLGPYEVLALLGKGGMGEVYRATDRTLGREVAIKMLPEAFTADPGRRSRLHREARLLASLNHPNIATVHSLEASDRSYGLVMELVPGQTLGERVAGGALPVDEALRVCRQIAEALDAAHQQGITHRDIKPANIKVTPRGMVKVLDFGLAKTRREMTRTPTFVATETGTREGVVLGTTPYMSPEQARGRAVDKQTDIWAFGCVLYELLAGRRAFAADTLSDTIAAILGREPDWQALPDQTPASVRRLLRRCLEKDVERRLRDIGDARIELQDALPSAAVGPMAASTGRVQSLAVLPFVNASGDADMEYLSDGLTETIILALSTVPQLRVMSRSAVFRYKGQQPGAARRRPGAWRRDRAHRQSAAARRDAVDQRRARGRRTRLAIVGRAVPTEGRRSAGGRRGDRTRDLRETAVEAHARNTAGARPAITQRTLPPTTSI